jgi:hypothetical protein
MRATISLDDRLGRAAKRRAAVEGLSLSAYIASLLEGAISVKPTDAPSPPFRLVTVAGGGPRPGIDLDRPNQILLAEDERR